MRHCSTEKSGKLEEISRRSSIQQCGSKGAREQRLSGHCLVSRSSGNSDTGWVSRGSGVWDRAFLVMLPSVSSHHLSMPSFWVYLCSPLTVSRSNLSIWKCFLQMPFSTEYCGSSFLSSKTKNIDSCDLVKKLQKIIEMYREEMMLGMKERKWITNVSEEIRTKIEAIINNAI